MPFLKKKFTQFIYKEKSGAVTKLKLIGDFRRSVIRNLRSIVSLIRELWYYHRIVIEEITHKIRTSAKHCLQRKLTWRLKQSQSNDKLL